ncbi:Uncharacterised protein [Enterobacter cloacae]|uniref:Uncharacterized protein n=1 Tax=Enterobacter cloacae TaxID=550 RepID=A0A377M011_ENTCL|nr:Uncharacterised protein [Enterobacter cloacae]
MFAIQNRQSQQRYCYHHLTENYRRIKTWRCMEDRRKTRIAPTQKGLDELKRYMSGAFIPVSILYPTFNIDLNLLDNDILRNNFFRRAAEYLFRGLTFKAVLPKWGYLLIRMEGE